MALDYLKLVENKLKPKKINNYTARNVKPSNSVTSGKQTLLPYGSNYVLLNETKTHKTNAINAYYHCDVETARDFALLELFCQGSKYLRHLSHFETSRLFNLINLIINLFFQIKVINESSYYILRTQEQLGK
jgi:hypothetical protein